MHNIDLGPPSLADADEFIAAARQSAALHRPWLSAPDTPERFAAYLTMGGASFAVDRALSDAEISEKYEVPEAIVAFRRTLDDLDL